MMNEQDEAQTFSRLAAALQDLYHYSALLSGRAESTFSSRDYAGLQGRLAAYASMRNTLSNWTHVPGLALWESLPQVAEIEKDAEMKRWAAKVFEAVGWVGETQGIDPRTGDRTESHESFKQAAEALRAQGFSRIQGDLGKHVFVRTTNTRAQERRWVSQSPASGRWVVTKD